MSDERHHLDIMICVVPPKKLQVQICIDLNKILILFSQASDGANGAVDPFEYSDIGSILSAANTRQQHINPNKSTNWDITTTPRRIAFIFLLLLLKSVEQGIASAF